MPESPDDLSDEDLEALQQQMDEDFEIATGGVVGWAGGRVCSGCGVCGCVWCVRGRRQGV
jgi:hypothetical protein